MDSGQAGKRIEGEVPVGVAYGAGLALTQAVGPCGRPHCPIRNGEVFAPEKCMNDECGRSRLGESLRAIKSGLAWE